jgi:hypothetical protein
MHHYEKTTKRVKIDLETIKTALAAAAADPAGRERWRDIEEHHLMLERRGGRVAWFFKSRSLTRKIGDVRKASYKAVDQLTPSDARAAAKRMLADLNKPPEDSAPAGAPGLDLGADGRGISERIGSETFRRPEGQVAKP